MILALTTGFIISEFVGGRGGWRESKSADNDTAQWRTQEFCSAGGVQQIQLRTEDRENGDLGAVAPWSGVLEAAVIWYKKFNFI